MNLMLMLVTGFLWGGSATLGESTEVAYHQYSEAVDLTGKDTLTLTGSNKAQVGELFLTLLDQSQMTRKPFTQQQLTSMYGEVADEVHHFPNAHIGRMFHDATLLFKDGHLIRLQWSYHKKTK